MTAVDSGRSQAGQLRRPDRVTATVALWTAVLGGAVGGCVAASWLVVRAFALAPTGPTALGLDAVIFGAALASSLVVLRLVAGPSAFQAGVLAGRELQRRENQRWMHDSVLQTFEAIALIAGHGSNPDTLEQVRRLAADNAAALRRTLTGPHIASSQLTEALEQAANAERLLGLQVALTLTDLDSPTPPDRVIALRDAAAEALRNVRKHAGTSYAQLIADTDEHTIRVEVRDNGSGFDPAAQHSSFGLRESVDARLREVGGGCLVNSIVDSGTSVVMWIPR